MSFELIGEKDVVEEKNVYTVKVFYDKDTNIQKIEYLIDEEMLFSQEYETEIFEEPETDIDIDAVVDNFEYWYGIVGPDWRPQGF